jgi:signal transduction histidine kinase
VLAGLIAEVDSATEGGEFYDHVCAALCRLTTMKRAGILLYDTASRAVRPVGSYGVDTELMAEVEGTLDETPIAQRALAEDRVMAASSNLETELPPRYARFAGITTVTCTPVAAGGRWLGVIFADQGGGQFELGDEERETMLILGRLAALAASVERSTLQNERTRQLSERISLVREIHERVMQRLFGLVLVLGSGKPLSAEEREACHDQLQSVASDLRSVLARPMAPHGASSRTTLRNLVERRAERTPGFEVVWAEGVEVPEELEELAQSVLLEALRNCEKHSTAERIEVRVDAHGEAFELDVMNDGILEDGGGGTGLGLRMLTLEALQHDALVEFGPLPEGRWHVRLVASHALPPPAPNS